MPEPVRRLFFALWPDPPLRTALHAAAMEQSANSGRGVLADNLHLTLAFAGPVDAALQACLEQGAADLRLPGFDLCVDSSGYFARPRIRWLGMRTVPVGLLQLAEALRTVLAACGVSVDKHPFQPHITIARRVPAPQSARPVTALRWSVRDFWLLESVSTPQGVRYLPIRSWKLEGQPASMG